MIDKGSGYGADGLDDDTAVMVDGEDELAVGTISTCGDDNTGGGTTWTGAYGAGVRKGG